MRGRTEQLTWFLCIKGQMKFTVHSSLKVLLLPGTSIPSVRDFIILEWMWITFMFVTVKFHLTPGSLFIQHIQHLSNSNWYIMGPRPGLIPYTGKLSLKPLARFSARVSHLFCQVTPAADLSMGWVEPWVITPGCGCLGYRTSCTSVPFLVSLGACPQASSLGPLPLLGCNSPTLRLLRYLYTAAGDVIRSSPWGIVSCVSTMNRLCLCLFIRLCLCNRLRLCRRSDWA